MSLRTEHGSDTTAPLPPKVAAGLPEHMHGLYWEAVVWLPGGAAPFAAVYGDSREECQQRSAAFVERWNRQ